MLSIKQFQNSRLSKPSLVPFSAALMQSYIKADCEGTKRAIMNIAFYFQTPNRWDIEDQYFKEFPLTRKKQTV